MDLIQAWLVSLAIALVVVAVVAVLLLLILRTARSIDEQAAGIWQVGKEIAGNTVSIWILRNVSEQLGQAREATHRLEASLDSIARHTGGSRDDATGRR